MERYVLDTSVFTNPDVYAQFGPDTLAAVRQFLVLAQRSGDEFYMPGLVYDELRAIGDLGEVAPAFERLVRIRSPQRFSLQIPAYVLYEFIEEVRRRIDRGLRIAEEHARISHRMPATGDLGPTITRLRERYREALRQGIVDSREDADVFLLAYELGAGLVSADAGLRKWADKVGVRLISPGSFRSLLEQPPPG